MPGEASTVKVRSRPEPSSSMDATFSPSQMSSQLRRGPLVAALSVMLYRTAGGSGGSGGDGGDAGRDGGGRFGVCGTHVVEHSLDPKHATWQLSPQISFNPDAKPKPPGGDQVICSSSPTL